MRRHQMLMLSLMMFMLGTLCQLYSMFSPEEPYIQQLSFMFVAMPSVLAIINHYYNHYQDGHQAVTPDESSAILVEERNTSITTQARKRVLFQPNDLQHDVVVDTSHRRSASGSYDALSGYDNDCTDDAILD
jgi:hypothetical protein